MNDESVLGRVLDCQQLGVDTLFRCLFGSTKTVLKCTLLPIISKL
jgi:hypothetical protein